MRIFMGLTEVAGYYNNLKEGFDELGIESVFVDGSGHRFGYGKEHPRNPLVSLVQYAGGKRNSCNGLPRRLWQLAYQATRLPLLIWALLRFDVFIFGFKSSLLPRFLDLPILKLCGKRVIYVFHGSDSRPPFINGALLGTDLQLSIADCLKRTRRQKEQVRTIERYADLVVNHPPTSHFHERKVVKWLSIGIPYPRPFKRAAAAGAKACGGSPTRVLHSPSHPESKGTSTIRRAVERLREKGYHIELVEVIGQPNEVVLAELALCDFVVDQVYSDTPMASFAAEAAIFGKPAVVGGYATARDWEAGSDTVPPSAYVKPDEIESVIQKLVVDKEYRLRLGECARSFVSLNWSAGQVAKRFIRLIDGDVPEEWWFDPSRVEYLHGYGLSETRARESARLTVEAGSVKALELGDKPGLEKSFVAFATGCDRCSSDVS
jgi:glycosyltransferase involved in cell wall biosynthesis